MDQQVVEYRPIPGFPGYRAGSDGSFWTCKKFGGRKRKWYISESWRKFALRRKNKKGYRLVSFSHNGTSKTFIACGLLLSLFKGARPPGMECRHLDGIKTNDSIGNLEWGTPLENMRDQYRHGTRVIGDRCHTVVLTVEQVIEMRKMYATGRESYRSLGETFGVEKSTVKAAITGKSWFWVPGGTKPGRRIGEMSFSAKLSEKDVVSIRVRCKAGESQSVIANEYGVTPQAIYNIVKRKTWKHIA